mmetsp:Transcript_15099/g.63708  ORF Transcript_15099/g.63708 Transcript_15099/m.63708 type:complete len:217 (-) Transcript_15099:841-1491(-)
MRCTRFAACASSPGLRNGSSRITKSACVSVKPAAAVPACSSRTRHAGSSRKRRTALAAASSGRTGTTAALSSLAVAAFRCREADLPALAAFAFPSTSAFPTPSQVSASETLDRASLSCEKTTALPEAPGVAKCKRRSATSAAIFGLRRMHARCTCARKRPPSIDSAGYRPSRWSFGSSPGGKGSRANDAGVGAELNRGVSSSVFRVFGIRVPSLLS